jgi:flagellar biosynthetic protein FliR
MMDDPALLLASLPAWAFAAVLLLARVGAACSLLPGIGEAELPATVRLLFVCAFSVLIFPGVMPLMPAVPADVPHILLMVAAELFTGLWLGWLTRLIMMALPMAGQMVAMAIGATNVLQPDAMLGAGASALSRLFGLAAPVLILAAGLHGWTLTALAGTYRLVPPGQFLPIADTTATVVTAVGEAFALALRLAGPFLMAALLFHVSIGLVARLVPQLQIYFAAAPGQIAAGLALLAVAMLAISGTWLEVVRGSLAALPGL